MAWSAATELICPVSPLLYACVLPSLTGKSILSPAQHESICVTAPFLSNHSRVLHSCGSVSAFTQHTESKQLELLVLIKAEENFSKLNQFDGFNAKMLSFFNVHSFTNIFKCKDYFYTGKP